MNSNAPSSSIWAAAAQKSIGNSTLSKPTGLAPGAFSAIAPSKPLSFADIAQSGSGRSIFDAPSGSNDFDMSGLESEAAVLGPAPNAFGAPRPATNAFGAPAATSAFGQPQPSAFSQPQPATNAFGQSQSVPNAFGQMSLSSSGGFGQPAAPPTNAFGQPAAPTTNAFGQPAAPSTNAFGQPAAPTFGQARPSAFGAGGMGAPAATQSAFGPGGMGAPAPVAQSAFGPGGMGAPATSPQPVVSAFGAGGMGPPSSASMTFGKPAQSTFGQPAAPAAMTFGAPAQSTFGQPKPSPFAQPTTSPAQPAQPQPFGSAPAASAPAPVFGKAPSVTSPTPSFGKVEPPPPSAFAAATASTSPKNTFGSPPAPASSGFPSASSTSYVPSKSVTDAFFKSVFAKKPETASSSAPAKAPETAAATPSAPAVPAKESTTGQKPVTPSQSAKAPETLSAPVQKTEQSTAPAPKIESPAGPVAKSAEKAEVSAKPATVKSEERPTVTPKTAPPTSATKQPEASESKTELPATPAKKAAATTAASSSTPVPTSTTPQSTPPAFIRTTSDKSAPPAAQPAAGSPVNVSDSRLRPAQPDSDEEEETAAQPERFRAAEIAEETASKEYTNWGTRPSLPDGGIANTVTGLSLRPGAQSAESSARAPVTPSTLLGTATPVSAPAPVPPAAAVKARATKPKEPTPPASPAVMPTLGKLGASSSGTTVGQAVKEEPITPPEPPFNGGWPHQRTPKFSLETSDPDNAPVRSTAEELQKARFVVEEGLREVRETLARCHLYHVQLKTPSPLSKGVEDLADRKRWNFADFQVLKAVINEIQAETAPLKERTLQYRRWSLELDSLVLKAETKKEECARLKRALDDKDYDTVVRIRQLGPEQSENQAKLRHTSLLVHNQLERLEDYVTAMRTKVIQRKSGAKPLTGPALDTVNRTIRNLDTAAATELATLELLSKKVQALREAYRDQLPAQPSLTEADQTTDGPSELRAASEPTRAPRISSKESAARLKQAFLNVRTTPLVNTVTRTVAHATHQDPPVSDMGLILPFRNGPLTIDGPPLSDEISPPQLVESLDSPASLLPNPPAGQPSLVASGSTVKAPVTEMKQIEPEKETAPAEFKATPPATSVANPFSFSGPLPPGWEALKNAPYKPLVTGPPGPGAGRHGHRHAHGEKFAMKGREAHGEQATAEGQAAPQPSPQVLFATPVKTVGESGGTVNPLAALKAPQWPSFAPPAAAAVVPLGSVAPLPRKDFLGSLPPVKKDAGPQLPKAAIKTPAEFIPLTGKPAHIPSAEELREQAKQAWSSLGTPGKVAPNPTFSFQAPPNRTAGPSSPTNPSHPTDPSQSPNFKDAMASLAEMNRRRRSEHGSPTTEPWKSPIQGPASTSSKVESPVSSITELKPAMPPPPAKQPEAVATPLQKTGSPAATLGAPAENKGIFGKIPPQPADAQPGPAAKKPEASDNKDEPITTPAFSSSPREDKPEPARQASSTAETAGTPNKSPEMTVSIPAKPEASSPSPSSGKETKKFDFSALSKAAQANDTSKEGVKATETTNSAATTKKAFDFSSLTKDAAAGPRPSGLPSFSDLLKKSGVTLSSDKAVANSSQEVASPASPTTPPQTANPLASSTVRSPPLQALFGGKSSSASKSAFGAGGFGMPSATPAASGSKSAFGPGGFGMATTSSTPASTSSGSGLAAPSPVSPIGLKSAFGPGGFGTPDQPTQGSVSPPVKSTSPAPIGGTFGMHSGGVSGLFAPAAPRSIFAKPEGWTPPASSSNGNGNNLFKPVQLPVATSVSGNAEWAKRFAQRQDGDDQEEEEDGEEEGEEEEGEEEEDAEGDDDPDYGDESFNSYQDDVEYDAQARELSDLEEAEEEFEVVET